VHAFNSISGIIKDVAGQSEHCSQMIGGKVRATISDDKGTRWHQNDHREKPDYHVAYLTGIDLECVAKMTLD
jgi:hypothetical protein